MERDMELVRQLLKEAIEGKEYSLIEIPEKFNNPEQYEIDRKIKYHLEIMKQHGLIQYEYFSYMSGKGHVSGLELTWDGQDYYSNIKNDTIWNNTKNFLKSKALSLSEVGFDTLLALAKIQAKELMGLILD